MRDGIFVSYAHADREWLVQLQRILTDLPSDVRVDLWDDTLIAPGARWHGEIKQALDTAAAAVLLLSPAFFGSEFIRTHELPAIVGAADRGELVVLPLVLATCDHSAVTAVYQSVHDPARPLASLDDASRNVVWQRLARSLNDVAATIGDETRIGAEMMRLGNDVVASPEVAQVIEKIARAKADGSVVTDVNEQKMRERALVFLEGERCQAVATRLMEEIKRADLSPARSKAVVRMLEQVGKEQEVALHRATELTQDFADLALSMITQGKADEPGQP